MVEFTKPPKPSGSAPAADKPVEVEAKVVAKTVRPSLPLPRGVVVK